jgi:ribonuclease Z
VSFSVTILGSGSAVPTSRRNPSAQFIQCASRNILIDCGEGTQMAMRKYGVKFQKLDIILISHMHGDHYFGLIGLLNTMHLLGRTKELKIFSPPALKEIIQLQVSAGNGGFSFPINYTAVEEGQNSALYEDVKIRITCFPLKHKIPTSGFIITEKEKERKLNKEKADKHRIKIEYYHRLKIGEDVRDEQGQLISQ